jgi:hypothetical protein
MEQCQSQRREYVRKNLGVLQGIIQLKFEEFAAEVVKEVGPVLGALTASHATTTKVVKLDLDQAQLDGRVARVEEWMDRYAGELVDEFERRLGQELLETYILHATY